jgi:hypothetical protein
MMASKTRPTTPCGATLSSTNDLRAVGNGHGSIDGAIFDVWKTHFDDMIPSGNAEASETLPEPTTAALLAIGCGFIYGVSRHR